MATPYVISSDLVSAYPAKSLEIAQYIDGFKADLALVQNAQTGTTYTLAAADFTKTVTLSNASPVAVTLPLEATVPWPAGTQLRLLNLGAGLVTVAGAVGVTINGSPLTLAQYKDGTLIKTGTDVWTFAGTSAAPGMDLITPTSVAGSGVTLSGAVVTVANAASASVNGCFTATYDQYVVTVTDYEQASAAETYFRLRAAGTNATTSYLNTVVLVNSAGAVQSDGVGQTSYFYPFYNGAATIQSFAARFSAPYLAMPTYFEGNSFRSDITEGRWAVGRHSASTSYDGFAIIPGAGNITRATIRIYGLRNS